MGNRVKHLEDKLAQRSTELEQAKEHQVSQFHQILQTTEKQRNEYETRLYEELSSIRQKTSVDLEEIRRNARELYEREIQALKSQLSQETEEGRRKESSLQQLRQQHSELMQQFHREKSKLESQLAGLEQQMNLKGFEADRIKVIYKDTLHSLQTAQLEAEKVQRKFEILSREYHQLQADTTQRIGVLEALASGRLQKLRMLGSADVPVVTMSASNNENEDCNSNNEGMIDLRKLQRLNRELAAQKTENSKLRAEASETETIITFL